MTSKTWCVHVDGTDQFCYDNIGQNSLVSILTHLGLFNIVISPYSPIGLFLQEGFGHFWLLLKRARIYNLSPRVAKLFFQEGPD